MGLCDCLKDKGNSIPNNRVDQNNQIFLKIEPKPKEKENKINEQSKLSICKVFGNGKKVGTGFLCKIPYESENFPVLITNKNIINKDELLSKNKIEITFNNDREERVIDIISERKIFSSKKYDITIIQIIPEKDDIQKFIDTEISNENYIDRSIYIPQYINGKECSRTLGKIIENNGILIKHNCQKYPGGPILLLESNEVIAINIDSGNGILLRESINEFNSFFKNTIKKNVKIDAQINNVIECIYKIPNEEEFNLLHDFNGDLFSQDQELIQLYNESKKKKKYLEDNIDIYIDSQQIKFNFKYKSNKNIIQVKFRFKRILSDVSFLFFDCQCLESVDLSSFDATYITNMNSMFYDCLNLKKVYLNSFKTKNDINMKYMFMGCFNLKLIELPLFEKIKVNGMKKMFNRCFSLESIDLTCFDTINVIDMNQLFSECKSLKSIKNLYSLNTSNVKVMSLMFSYCPCLKSIDLSKFNTKNVLNMNGMFSDCRSLISLDLSSFNTANVENMGAMFMMCHSIKSINLSSFNTNKVIDMSFMFNGCESLKSINLTSFNTNKVKKMNGMFYGCISLKSIDLSSFETPNATDIDFMFTGCKNLQSLDLSKFNTINANKKYYQPLIEMIFNYYEDYSQPIDNIFFECHNLKNIKCKDRYILEMFESAKKDSTELRSKLIQELENDN